MARPFKLNTALDYYKYDLLEYTGYPGIDFEYFHCADDNRYVRKRVFELVSESLKPESATTLVVEKAKTLPPFQVADQFYPLMLGCLLGRVLNDLPDDSDEVIIVTDQIPLNKKRKAVEKAIKLTVAKMLVGHAPYKIMHHASRSHYGLQVADYINWATFRKWEHGDDSAYQSIRPLFKEEIDLFGDLIERYY